MFSGHTQQNTLLTPARFGGKTVAQTGNFAHTGDSNPTTIEEYKDCYWGIRELLIDSETALSRYILMNNDNVGLEYSYRNEIKYY